MGMGGDHIVYVIDAEGIAEHGENELRIRCVPAVDHQYFIVADNDGGIRLAYVHEDDTQKGFLGPCSVNR